MTATTHHSPFLKALLRFDAATCLLAGLALLLFASSIQLSTGVSGSVAAGAAATLLAFGLYIAALAFAGRSPAWAVWLVVVVNIGWCIASIEYALMDVDPLTAIGSIAVIGQGIAVLGLGLLEGKALRDGMHRPAMA